MPCNETQEPATLESLTPAKILAVEAMLAGKTITAAAAAAGVDRGTVHRWLHHDFAFQAEWNLRRREMRRATCGSLERLAAKAAGCIEKAIDEGDVKAALEILNRLRLFAPDPIGSDDPAELAQNAADCEEENRMWADEEES